MTRSEKKFKNDKELIFSFSGELYAYLWPQINFALTRGFQISG